MNAGRGLEVVGFISLLAIVAPACGDESSKSDQSGGGAAVSGGATGENGGGSSAAGQPGGRAGGAHGGEANAIGGPANAGASNGGAGPAAAGVSSAAAGSDESGGVGGAAGEIGSGGEGGAAPSAPLPDPRCADAVANALQGSGSSVDPYLICLPQQLSLLETGPYTLDRNFELGADLDLATLTKPLLTFATYLEGTFDGRSHTLSGLSNTLFNFVETPGTVRDLNVSGSIETVSAAIVATSARGTFRRVHVSGKLTAANHSGPLVGSNQGLIEDCSSSTTVESGGPHVGGLVGSNSGTIRRSFSTGSVSGAQRVGGLVGSQSTGTIEQSYALGPVTAMTSVGGLVGSHFGGEIRDCYARSPLVTGTEAGGLVGQIEPRDATLAALIIDSYSTSVVMGTGAEGLVGFVSGTLTNYTVTRSYFIDTASGTLGTPLGSAQLKLQSSYAGWSFGSIWKMDPKLSAYPSLAFEAH